MTTVTPGWIRPPRQPSNCARGAEPEPEQQDRERKHDVGDPRQDRVDPTAEVARDQAERDADEGRERGPDDPDQQRYASPVDNSRHDVLAETIDAEWMGARGAERRPERVAEIGVLDRGARKPEDARDQWRKDCHQNQQQDEPRRHDRDPIGAKPAPEQLQRRAGGDLAREQLDGVRRRSAFDHQLWSANAHQRALIPRITMDPSSCGRRGIPHATGVVTKC